MEIRYAKKRDLPQLIELCKHHAEYEQAAYDEKGKPELLAGFLFGQTPSLKCLVVEQANSLIGYATFMKQFSTWDAGYYIYLDCLFLKEAARGKGLGGFIMERLKEYVKIENCSSLQWQTPDSNQKAIDFYRKIGGVSKRKERFFLNI